MKTIKKLGVCVALISCQVATVPEAAADLPKNAFAVVGSKIQRFDGRDFDFSKVVITDARCPKDVQCIRAGEAIAAFSLSIGGQMMVGPIKLCLGCEPSMQLSDAKIFEVNAKRYSLKLVSVDPYPSKDDQNPAKKAWFVIE